MAIGKKSQPFTIVNTVRVNNGTPTTSSETFTNTAEYTYPSPRKRPNPLTDTGGALVLHVWDNGVYSDTVPLPGIGTRTKSGSATYVFGSAGRVVVQDSQGDANTDLLVASGKLASGKEDLGQFFAEINQTAGMIAARIRQMAEFLLQLKKGNYSAAAKAVGVPLSRRQLAKMKASKKLGDASDAWLEYAFGWRQLMQDVYGSLEAYADGMAPEGKTRQATKRTPKGLSQLTNAQLTTGMAHSATIRGTISNSSVRTLQELGLLNPFALSWELTRLSFVVDWFVPVGAIFQTLTSTAGLRDVVRTVTWESRATSYTTTRDIPWYVSRFLRREVRGFDPTFSALDFRISNFGVGKITTALALLVQHSKSFR